VRAVRVVELVAVQAAELVAVQAAVAGNGSSAG
jgi:hypothetical protein